MPSLEEMDDPKTWSDTAVLKHYARCKRQLQKAEDAKSIGVCSTCLFWEESLNRGDHGPLGYCRRYPPRPSYDQPFPLVDPRGWCGEWQANSEMQESNFEEAQSDLEEIETEVDRRRLPMV